MPKCIALGGELVPQLPQGHGSYHGHCGDRRIREELCLFLASAHEFESTSERDDVAAFGMLNSDNASWSQHKGVKEL